MCKCSSKNCGCTQCKECPCSKSCDTCSQRTKKSGSSEHRTIRSHYASAQEQEQKMASPNVLDRSRKGD